MPSPIALPAPLTARLGAVSASVVLAGLLNAGALAVVAGSMSPPSAPAAQQPPPPLRARLVMLTAAPQPAAPALRVRATGATPAQPAQQPQARVPALASAAVQPFEAPTNGAAPRPLRLYGFDEVDVPARPESEWALDIATLDSVGITRLAFELLVSEHGEVLACTVLAPAGLDDAVRRDLEQRLALTRLLPAERHGRQVASVRRIDLRIEADN